MQSHAPSYFMMRLGSRYLGGALLVLVVDVLWTVSNYISNVVLTHGYDKPFALTFVNTASFVIYLVPFAALYFSRGQRGCASDHRRTYVGQKWYERLGFRLPPSGEYTAVPDVERLSRSQATHASRGESHEQDSQGSPDSYDSIERESISQMLPPLTLRETVVLAAQFAVMWFAANWSFTAALGLTSVASGTTIGSASGFFTLLLGIIAGIDRFSSGKLLAVVLSFVGVALVTWADTSIHVTAMSISRTLWGDLLALLSAFCYAAYMTLLKARIGSESRIYMPLFLGLVGAFNLLAFWPLGLLLDVLGIEPLALPSDRLMALGVLFNMIITVVSCVRC